MIPSTRSTVLESRVVISISHQAVLDVSEHSVVFQSQLLQAERVRRGYQQGTRAPGTVRQAVLILRWFLDDTRMAHLAQDNGISASTAHDYRDEVSRCWPPARRPCTARCWRPGCRARPRDRGRHPDHDRPDRTPGPTMGVGHTHTGVSRRRDTATARMSEPWVWTCGGV